MSIACQVAVVVLLQRTRHTLGRENSKASSKNEMCFYEGRAFFCVYKPLIMIYLWMSAFLAHGELVFNLN
jgi:hypothetical protein